jgi:hypothetical protein
MMSDLVDYRGMPIGRVGESRPLPDDGPRYQIDPMDLIRAIEQKQKTMKGEAAIARREHVSIRKVEEAISFWKRVYFGTTAEGRLLNGIEAYELGDPKRTPAAKVDKGPYIAMCNLMALEAVKMMGDHMPTSEDAITLAFATDREREIAKFWKDNFAPTEFQVEWAWKGALAVMAGEPTATNEILEEYKSQLP